MGMRTAFIVAALAVVSSTSVAGCIVPDNMQVLREELGLATLDAPVVRIRADALQPVVGLPVAFTAVVVGGAPPYTFDWDLGGVPAWGPVIAHTWDAPGAYDVRLVVTAADGATGTDALRADVRENTPPVAVAAVEGDARAVPGEPVRFTASGSSDPDGHPLRFTWRFDDGATAAGADVVHAFDDAGAHTATVTVHDGMASAEAAVGVAIDAASRHAGTAHATEAFTVALRIAPGAAGLSGTVRFARGLMVEEIEVALTDPSGRVRTWSSDAGIGTADDTVPFALDAPAPGSWVLAVRLVRGVESDVDVGLAAAYVVPA